MQKKAGRAICPTGFSLYKEVKLDFAMKRLLQSRMVCFTVSVGNQSLCPEAFAVLVHCFAVSVIRVVALTVTRYQPKNLSLFNRFSGFPRLLGLRRTELVVATGSSRV
jgi:hypothetical protein